MAVTSSNIPSAEKVPATKSTLWQEEMRGKDQADGGSGIGPAQSPMQGPAGAASSMKDPVLDSKEGERWGWMRCPLPCTRGAVVAARLGRTEMEINAEL